MSSSARTQSQPGAPAVPKPVLTELTRIPGVGPSIARDLFELGISRVSDLRNSQPEQMYAELCEQAGRSVDRCVLYVFRCAVYYASESAHQPELLKWWNWKDEKDEFGRPGE